MSLDKKTAYGFALRLVGRPEEALEQFKQVLVIDPTWQGARFFLSATYADLGRRDEAAAEYVGFLKRVVNPPQADALAASAADAYAMGGWDAFLQRDIEISAEGARHPDTLWPPPYGRFCSHFWMACRYARHGDRDKALTELEAAYDARDHHLQIIHLDPAFAALRSDPRFRELVQRIGIPSSSPSTQSPQSSQ